MLTCQPQTGPRYNVGDVVCYANHPMIVGMVLTLAVPPHPSHSPGIYYALRTEAMIRDLWLIVPAYEVETVLPVVA